MSSSARKRDRSSLESSTSATSGKHQMNLIFFQILFWFFFKTKHKRTMAQRERENQYKIVFIFITKVFVYICLKYCWSQELWSKKTGREVQAEREENRAKSWRFSLHHHHHHPRRLQQQDPETTSESVPRMTVRLRESSPQQTLELIQTFSELSRRAQTCLNRTRRWCELTDHIIVNIVSCIVDCSTDWSAPVWCWSEDQCWCADEGGWLQTGSTHCCNLQTLRHEGDQSNQSNQSTLSLSS